MTTVSVVMSVYDEPGHVKKTIESVLRQDGVDFEFIIVSDGASDTVVEVVRSYLDDERVRFIEQLNQGLTVALINGCNQANSPFIARIDAGDMMLESRLMIQYNALIADESLGVIASWVRVETLEGHFLYDVKLASDELETALKSVSEDDIKTPFHASVMFRKSVYDKVGGYRAEFYFSQDCDLWTRMVEHSGISVSQEALTVGVFSASGISGRYADTQRKMKALVAKANTLRQQGEGDDVILSQAHELRPSKQANSKPIETDEFSGVYFIARVLTDNKSGYAKKYWREALKIQPWNFKVWLFYSLSLFYKPDRKRKY